MTDPHTQDPLFDLTEGQQPAEAPADPPTPTQVITDLLEVRRHNAVLYEELTAGRVRPEPVGVVLLKLETLIELALPPHDRNQVELAFERRMTGVLESCLSEMRQIEITQGVTAAVPPTLIVPGR